MKTDLGWKCLLSMLWYTLTNELSSSELDSSPLFCLKCTMFTYLRCSGRFCWTKATFSRISLRKASSKLTLRSSAPPLKFLSMKVSLVLSLAAKFYVRPFFVKLSQSESPNTSKTCSSSIKVVSFFSCLSILTTSIGYWFSSASAVAIFKGLNISKEA